MRVIVGRDRADGFDCSGFVWSIFQATGIDFERGGSHAGRALPWQLERKKLSLERSCSSVVCDTSASWLTSMASIMRHAVTELSIHRLMSIG